MKRLIFILSTFILTLITIPVFAAQEIIMIESTITGSQEQPKVISIVPWQKPIDPDYFGTDITGLGMGADVFQTLDRDAFNREMQYMSSMRKGTQK